ncbi:MULTISPECIES: YHYH protein [Pseudoalteromonas]|nr:MULTISPECIES: YHYH protein [Pseudoalteromonas]
MMIKLSKQFCASLLLGLLTITLLTGCGGSGSDSSSVNPPSDNNSGDTPDDGDSGDDNSGNSNYSGSGAITQGVATTTTANLFPSGSRVSAVGSITDSSQQSWIVPADTLFQSNSMPFAADLYNSYVSGHNYASAAAAEAALDGTDIIEIDADGEVITAYIFADNYFEMYVNGNAVGKDPVPFTEFNSNIVRFKVKQPFTVAMALVDWEETLGTGTENNQGSAYAAGDGGMVAVFKDSNGHIVGVTNNQWKAQTYYTAPIVDPTCLSESDSQRLSSSCSTGAVSDISAVYGVHWSRPANWMSENFDDSSWPSASSYTNETVGVDNKQAYTNFTAVFDDAQSDAQFIWSSNLVLDNEVLVRGTIGDSTGDDDSTDSGDFQLTSKAVKSDNIVPLSATCDGADGGKSVSLQWSGAPSQTQSYALSMHHFPNPNDAGDFSKAHSYWTVYDIPAATVNLASGETAIGVFGINSVNNQQQYAAPCSADSSEHDYTITLYALSSSVGSLGLSGSTTDLVTLRDAIAPHTLGTAKLSLTRSRYNPNNDQHVPQSVATTCAAKSAAFAAYSDHVSVSCSDNTMSVTTHTLLPYRSQLDSDKANVGIRSWIGRVPIAEQLTWTLPITPSYLPTPQSNINIHHAVGVSVEGIPILHYAKESQPDEIAQLGQDYSSRDTVLLGEIDQCGGHAGNGEDYHYHMAPICLMDSHDPSLPLAYMFDGLPLYFGTGGGVKTTGGTDYGAGRYEDLNYLPLDVKNGSNPLDDCNAYDLHGDGSEYVYYSTSDAPYSIGCFRAQANQEGSVPGGPHWVQERDLSWSGNDVLLTDYDTMSFSGKTWQFIEVTPGESNNRIAAGKKALIMYRQLASGDSGYDPNANCYAFRYRLDSTDTAGTNDTYSEHCR